MDELIAVVIPVYNVENYLKRCIDSVIAQTYTNLEIWLVDDGSTDGSGKICDEYAAKDNRIKVIHKENGGLSDARNVAIDRASGSYITFVDSDDFIHEEMIRVLYKSLVDNDADISLCREKSGDKNAFGEKTAGTRTEVIFEKETIFESIFDDRYRNTVIPAWDKLYKKALFEDIRYPVGKIHEDEFVIHHILNKCEKTVLIEDELYYHYVRQGSITRDGYSMKSLDAVEAVEERCSFFEHMSNKELIFLAYKDYLRRIQFHYYSLKKYFPENTTLPEQIRNRYKERYEAIKNELGQKARLRYGLFLWMPNMNRLLKSMMGARMI